MQTECTDTAFSTDARIVPSQLTLDQIASISENAVAEDGDIWMPMALLQQPIWPRL